MKIKRYEKCIGLSFPAIGKYKVEIWYAPRGYRIAAHSHPMEDIKLMFLLGNNIKFWRQRPNDKLPICFLARWYHAFKVFTINAGDVHYFEVSDWPLIFINFEKWHIKPTSAAEDFKLVKEEKDYYATKR